MNGLLVTSLFCEDIRHEAAGQRSIIGLLNDSIAVPTLPIAFPRLSILVRVSVLIDLSLERIAHRLFGPDGEQIAENIVSQKLIETTRSDAEEKNHPMYGFISEFQMTMLKIEKPGIFKVISELGEEKVLSGFLSVIVSPDLG